LIWSIIQYWQGKDVMESAAPDSKQNNIEKFLLTWCQEQTKRFEDGLSLIVILHRFALFFFRYPDVRVHDFTRSWQDGRAFNALIHKFRPDLFNYEDIQHTAPAKALEHAFSVAKDVFKIDRYLDVEGMCCRERIRFRLAIHHRRLVDCRCSR
jgi:hypothetical protein